MSDWTDGYVNEISYTAGYYPEMSPWMLYYATLALGYRPPKIEETFNYCELGSGLGFSANLHAAGSPQGNFYCTDFNPGHTVAAQEMASAAGLENIQFFDKSFADFEQMDLPEFDVIVLHGIYSWVSEQNRKTILDIISSKLRVGGVVYISYNTEPGWATLRPVRDLLIQLAKTSTDPLETRIDRAFAFVDKLMESKAGYFTQNPSLAERISDIKGRSKNYLAHEFFNETWTPFFFQEVAKELSDAKLSFVGSSVLLNNFDFHAPEVVTSVGDPLIRETLRDFLRNTMFRKDLFVRGPVRLNGNEQRQMLDQVSFTLVVDRESVHTDVQKGMYTYNLKPAIYEPILDALCDGPKSMKELRDYAALAHVKFSQLHQAMQMLIGVSYVMPGPSNPDAHVQEKCLEFNRAVANYARTGGNSPALVSPHTGAGISLDRVSHLIVEATRREGNPAEFVADTLLGDGLRFSRNGQELGTREENIQQANELLELFKKKTFNTLARCGIEIGNNT